MDHAVIIIPIFHVAILSMIVIAVSGGGKEVNQWKVV